MKAYHDALQGHRLRAEAVLKRHHAIWDKVSVLWDHDATKERRRRALRHLEKHAVMDFQGDLYLNQVLGLPLSECEAESLA